MTFPSDTISIVLAGGVGSRLSPLTQERAKPAVPFGGQYRIIDFTLSNCLHSGLRQVLVLTQYKSQSMQTHLRDGWSIFNPAFGEYITAVPPQMRTGDSWYCGTADAIYQNLYLLERSGAKNVVILSGDHIYRMDYSEMLRQHESTSADATVGCLEVGLRDAQSFGVMSVDQGDRICEFQEKPLHPRSIPGKPNRALASMGIYVFSIELLRRELVADHNDPNSSHDFGKDLLPRLIHTNRVFGYRFHDPCEDSAQPYWRDVGTIDAYYRANMELLKSPAPLDLYCKHWPIRKCDSPAPPARIGVDSFGKPAEVTDCIVCNGAVISGGTVERSILSSRVSIASGAVVEDAVLFDGVEVGEGAQVRNCIIDKDVRIPPGKTVGVNPVIDAERFTVSENGVVVIPKGYKFAPVRKQTLTPSQPRTLIRLQSRVAVGVR